MKKVIQLFFLLLCLPAVGQHDEFGWRSKIPSPDSAGFYRIQLTPEVLSKISTDLRDIRIFNAENQEIPWISKTASREVHSYQQIPLRIVQNQQKPKCCTELIIENTLNQPLSRINLTINNADVKKELSISGSDDLSNWYIVKEKAAFTNFQIQTATAIQKSIWFPPSSYRYFRITINDSLSLPLKINSASTEGENREWGQYQPTPLPEIAKSDSAELRKTYIWLSFTEPYPFDKLIFHIQQPALYHRNARLYQVKTGKKEEQILAPLTSFTLSPVLSNTLDLPRIKGKRFLIVIENEDNPPLKIEKIQPYFLETSLIMHTSAPGDFHLAYGNKSIKAPQYDLGFFRELIPSEIPALKPNEPEIKSDDKKKLAAGSSFAVNSTWVWLAIAFVVCILLFMSVKMVKEMQKA